MAETRFSKASPVFGDFALKPLTSPSEQLLLHNASVPTARAVKLSLTSRLLNIAMDLLLLGCCISFLAFAALVKMHDNAQITRDPEFSTALLQASKYGPTVFPILFAAVVSRTIKTFIQWRLQRGERLGTLDLLSTSTSVGGAVTAQLAVRRISILGTALIAIWALSPIGGQASLRVLWSGNDTMTVPIRYVIPSMDISPWTSGSDKVQRKPLVNSMWLSLLLGNEESRTATMDIWNNVKIPMIEPLEANQTADVYGWYSVSSNTTEYASLAGIPISPRLSTSAVLSFPVETWYWALDCQNLTSNRIWIMIQSLTVYSNASQRSNSTWKNGVCDMGGNRLCLLTDTDTLASRHPDDANMPFRQIFFSAEDYSFEGGSTNLESDIGASVSAGVCSMSTTYMEAQIQCIGRDCAAKKVRRSLSPLSVPAWTAFDSLDSGALQFLVFSEMFTNSVESNPSDPTAISAYMANPNSPFSRSKYPPASTLSHLTYSVRVAQLLNTYWAALSGTSVITSGIGDRNGSEPGTFWDVRFVLSLANGIVTVPNSVLKCHNGWFIASVTASGALLVICLAAPLLRAWTGNPELALNFSSLLRDNAYVTVSGTSTSLQAPDRARFMGDLKIKFGDVKPEEAVGHLALASMNSNVVWRVRKGRMYS